MNQESQSQKSNTALREEAVLAFWKEKNIFQKSLEKPSPKGEFVFFEGPPTANAKPALHHLEARAFKDVLPRYKTMQGYHVRRRAGWDTHGLPVELQIEKKLGFTHKKQIEEYGIAAFNKECKESVFTHIKDWEAFTDRIGYWVDQEHAYYTFDTNYIESLWNILAEVDKKDLLYKDYKVVPWCARCGTVLASHELAQGYQDDKDLSVTAKFKVKGEENTYLLAWTTTPWTLPGNVGLAVGKDIKYGKWKIKEGDFSGDTYIVAVGRAADVFKDAKIFPTEGKLEEIAEVNYCLGEELVGLEYEPLYPYLSELIKGHHQEKNMEHAYKVYAADFVTTTDGTGIVHTAVMYGADDFELGTKVGLPKFHTVNEEGRFILGTDFLEGRFVKDEDVAVDIIKDLAHRGLLFKKEKYEHSYPHCWRCKTPLIYYARDSWYIRMSDLRDTLVNENEGINWEPSHIKEGRFGEWLREVKDWAISRERYWGTPLPIWHREHDGVHDRIVVDSIETLKKYSKGGKLPTNESGELDLHRPYIDDIILEKDGHEFHRVKEVMDVWFDSGSMPFAQDHYSFEGKDLLYPADFISEAIDQTRGWFYTLHAVGNLLGKGKAYKNVICLGHLLDKDGKKMSKSIGNIVEPFEQIEKFGADTIRLWMYSVNAPGESKNYDEKTVGELQRQFFNLLYNVVAFYKLYRDPYLELDVFLKNLEVKNQLNKEILSRLNQLILIVTDSLEKYKISEATRSLKEFVDELSTWYLRRSRDLIKNGDEETKKTLYISLKTFAQLISPFAPFAAEDLWYWDNNNDGLRNASDTESIHLSQWPEVVGEIDLDLIFYMEIVKQVCSVGNALRKSSKIPVRQALSTLAFTVEVKQSGSPVVIPKELYYLICDELNIKEVKQFEKIEQSEFDDKDYITMSSRGVTVAINKNITPELKAEGNYRELVRAVQDLRKESGLTPQDTIALTMSPEAKDFLTPFLDELKKAVLAKNVHFADNDGAEIKIDEIVLRVKIEK